MITLMYFFLIVEPIIGICLWVKNKKNEEAILVTILLIGEILSFIFDLFSDASEEITFFIFIFLPLMIYNIILLRFFILNKRIQNINKKIHVCEQEILKLENQLQHKDRIVKFIELINIFDSSKFYIDDINEIKETERIMNEIIKKKSEIKLLSSKIKIS